jgi:small subunit ribosomal protein S21
MRVDVRNNNVEKALRILKKKLQQDGLFNELREREFHMTKGEKGRRSRAAAIRRDAKSKQKRMEEHGY